MVDKFGKVSGTMLNDKTKTLGMENGELELDPGQPYKYLGIYQRDNEDHYEIRRTTRETYLKRLRLIINSNSSY